MNLKEKIAEKLSSMKMCVDFLKSNSKVTVYELEEDYTLKSAVERNFQMALESVADIGQTIIAELNFEKAEDYKSILITLGKHRILPEEFAKRFSPAMGFRNILVHKYEKVDVEIMHEFLTEKLGDFDEFAKHITNFLNRKNL